jgi:hypothetical protein
MSVKKKKANKKPTEKSSQDGAIGLVGLSSDGWNIWVD